MVEAEGQNQGQQTENTTVVRDENDELKHMVK